VDQQTIQQFVNTLYDLASWQLSLLRHGYTPGQMYNPSPAPTPRAMQIFLTIVPEGISEPEEETLFLVTYLFANTRHHSGEGNLGLSARILANRDPNMKNVLERRLMILLDTTHPAYLRRNMLDFIKCLDRQGIGVNYQRLIEDLLNWHDPNCKVKIAWLRSFLLPPPRPRSKSKP